MPGKIATRTDSALTSPLEASSMDLMAYVHRRLNTESGPLTEPAWFAVAFDASWPLAFAEAAAWCA